MATAPFRRVLFHGAADTPLAAALASGATQARVFDPDRWTLAADEVGVVLAGPSLMPVLAEPTRPQLGDAADRVALLLLGDRVGPLDRFWSARVSFALPAESPAEPIARAVGSLLRLLEDRARFARDRRALLDRQSQVQALVDVGLALAAETDRDRLLETILSRARTLTSADAGSLYLVETGPAGPRLRFARSQNDTVRADFETSLLPLDEASIAGFVASTGEVVNLVDVRQLPVGAPYRFDAGFDERHGYKTRSVLAVPLSTPDGRRIGVLQLINRKRRVLPDSGTTAFIRAETVPFEAGDADIARALAAQAAVAVENHRLTESVRSLFEGFVEASVTAIEQRDPATSGHSHRVALLTCGLAEAVDRVDAGPYADWHASDQDLRELRYAAVLHDFGKVGVREEVLVKARKLSPAAFAVLRGRFDQAALAAAAEIWEQAARGGRPPAEAAVAIAARRSELEAAWSLVERSNAPTVLTQEVRAELEALRGLTFRGPAGEALPLVAPAELDDLAIPLGSLTPAERVEIESHVTQTHRFLSRIPWTHDLARVSEWAYAHHEKLDGSGYPRRLRAAQIPAPVRMLTICDIYDALAARDRPYKRAVEPGRALEILAAEAARGTVDAELLRIFTEARIFERAEPA